MICKINYLIIVTKEGVLLNLNLIKIETTGPFDYSTINEIQRFVLTNVTFVDDDHLK